MSEQNFEQIYQKYFDPVYRYALSLTLEEHQAEEITQETFFKALKSKTVTVEKAVLKPGFVRLRKTLICQSCEKRKRRRLTI